MQWGCMVREPMQLNKWIRLLKLYAICAGHLASYFDSMVFLITRCIWNERNVKDAWWLCFFPRGNYSQSSDGRRDLEISVIFRSSPWCVVDFVIIFVVTMACSSFCRYSELPASKFYGLRVWARMAVWRGHENVYWFGRNVPTSSCELLFVLLALSS
jgi:hypothetical protein